MEVCRLESKRARVVEEEDGIEARRAAMPGEERPNREEGTEALDTGRSNNERRPRAHARHKSIMN